MKKKIAKVKVSQEEFINSMLAGVVGEIFLESLNDSVVTNNRIYNTSVKNSTQTTLKQLDKAITDLIYADTSTSVEEFKQVKALVKGEFQDVINSFREQMLSTIKIKE